MSKRPPTKVAAREEKPTDRPALLLLGDVADTTWRMFIPTIGMMVLGLAADMTYESTPMLTFAGVIVGAAIAVWLVWLQIKRLRSS
ncbi:hypothetical protein CR983_00830 [Candidatus Saccharibacteria bacterium]|nr:MAG: hypothetical protein CR983_00830 [Candidatus Saccharibacteria bacterium]